MITFLIIQCKSNIVKPPAIYDYPGFEECDAATENAINDYHKGIKEYDILGTIEMTKFEQFY